MMHIENLIESKPYDYNKSTKDKLFFLAMMEAMEYHYNNNYIFKKWLNKTCDFKSIKEVSEIPFFPSSVFKYINFNNGEQNYKTIESSGTTNQLKSKISVDTTTSQRQTKVLSKILQSLIGKRKPFLIIDFDPNKSIKSKNYSARFAGMAGYLLGASKKIYCLSRNNKKIVENFNDLIFSFQRDKKPIVIIGYTYMIFKFLLSSSNSNNFYKLPEGSKVIHFGGWKKMYDKRISKRSFNQQLMNILGVRLDDIYDIYGFTEQLGTVYPSLGNNGNKIPIYSHVIIRNPDTLLPVEDGEEGLVQFLSPIPNSYPGISLLNDDIGRIVKNNKNLNPNIIEFEITGRPDRAEPRGCGDTLPDNYYL